MPLANDVSRITRLFQLVSYSSFVQREAVWDVCPNNAVLKPCMDLVKKNDERNRSRYANYIYI